MDPNSILWAAAKSGDVDAIESALQAGADVNAQDPSGATALMHAAAHSRKPEAVEILLRHKADTYLADNTGRSALCMAIAAGRLMNAEALLDYGADINHIAGLSIGAPLHIAIEKDHADNLTARTSFLLERKASPLSCLEHPEAGLITALEYAAMEKHGRRFHAVFLEHAGENLDNVAAPAEKRAQAPTPPAPEADAASGRLAQAAALLREKGRAHRKGFQLRRGP